MFGMSTMTVYRAIGAGEFPAIRGPRAAVRAGTGHRGDGRGRDRRPDRRRRGRVGPRGGGPVSSVFEHLDQVVERLAVAARRAAGRRVRVDRAPVGGGVRGRGAGVVAGLRAVEPAAGVAGGAGRGGGRAGERGAVGAARRRSERAGGAAGRELGCRSGGCAPPGGPHHERCRGWSVMHSVGALILFSILGAVICAKARVAGGAVVFSLIGLVLFVSTPAGRALPEAVSGFVSAVDGAATPALTDETERPREAAVPADDGRGRRDERRRSVGPGGPSGPGGPRNSGGPPAAAGPVGPRRSTAGLPVKGAALRSASLRDGLRPPCDREPRRPCTPRRTAAG